ncbi:MAG: insulinase family protein [Asticcacaulis sp.]
MAYATDTAYSPDAFANFKSSLGYMYSNMRSAPATVVAMNESHFLTSGDPRYGFPAQADMEKADAGQLTAIFRRTMTNVPVEVTVTGDISDDAALKQIARTFANLPPVPAAFTVAPGADHVALPQDHTPQVWYHDGRDDQAVAVIAFPTTDALTDLPTTRGLSLLAAVLEIRLTEDLREQQGATYDIEAQAYGSEIHKGYGYLQIECTLKPDMDKAFADAVLKAAADLRDHGVTADELNRARMPLLDGLNDKLKNNEDWQATIAGLYGHPELWDYKVDVARQYMRVSTDDIQRLAQTYLKPETLLHMEAVPAPKP